MAEQQLFCDPDDRHRAVLLAGCLKDMGQPARLVDAPEPPAPRALLLWTNRASRSPWLSQLLRDNRDLIVLAIDSAPLPADCSHVLALQTWPARSADRSLGELVSWLKDTSQPGPFPRRARASTEPGGGSALIVLAVMVLVIGAAVLGSRGPEAEDAGGQEATAALEPGRAAPAPRGALTGTSSGAATRSPALGTARSTDAASGRATPTRAADAGSASRGDRALTPTPTPTPTPAPSGTETSSAGVELPDPRPEAVEPAALAGSRLPVGGSSLDHLCRARSLAAARAWYRVLTDRQRREAQTLPCVRALLDKPGYEPLREEIQA